MARRHAPGWAQVPGWGQPFPGWEPLDDPATLPLRAARALRRWWWPITAVAGFLAVVGYALAHDPQPGLSDRGWLTLTLAAVVVLLLTAHRANRGRPPRWPLARAVAEYAVVALLAVLLVTAGAGQPPTGRGEDGGKRRQATEQPAHRHPPTKEADAGPAADRRPRIVRAATGVWGWLADLWHTAGELADRHPTSTTSPKQGQALAPSPTPPSWRSHR